MTHFSFTDQRLNRRDFVRVGSVLAATLAVPLPRAASAAPLQVSGSVGSAFVVGIDRYRSIDPLTRAANDARAVAERLATLGYRTFTAIDLTRAAILDRFAEFKSSVSSGGAAFLYFAGHGLQLRGTNFLLPTDVDCSSAEKFHASALSLNDLLRDIAGLRPEQAVAVIDACRNPLSEVELPDRQGGMTSVDAPGGFFMLYSAGAGQFALESLGEDDPVANSVFTRHLLPALRREQTIDDIFYRLAEAVPGDAATVLHRQNPAAYNQSGRPLRLVPAAVAAAVPAPPTAPGRMESTAVLLVAMQAYEGYFVPGENGVAGYEGGNLLTPRMDVRRLDRAFRALGAETLTLVEPNRELLREACAALREIGRRDFVVYFAGAGGLRGGDGTILIQGHRKDEQGRLLVDYVSSRELVTMLLPAREPCAGRTATILIDSCLVDHGFKVGSDGPLPLIESLRRGDRDDVALLYSAAYGQAAADWITLPGAPPTSPGAQALLELLGAPLTIGALAAAFRVRVEALTEGAQTPQLFASPRAIAREFITPAAFEPQSPIDCPPPTSGRTD